jgi:hypothetical protein
VTGRRERRCTKLIDDIKGKCGYWKLKKEALDRPMWRTRFGRGYGPVVRQKTERICLVLTHFFPIGGQPTAGLSRSNNILQSLSPDMSQPEN